LRRPRSIPVDEIPQVVEGDVPRIERGHAIGARVVPIDLDVRTTRDVWLTYHADAGRIPRIRHLIDWLVDCFEPKQFPWFRDEFIHSKEFPELYRGPPLPNHFEGFGVAVGSEVTALAAAAGAAARGE
jgi:hypothetical protein